MLYSSPQIHLRDLKLTKQDILRYCHFHLLLLIYCYDQLLLHSNEIAMDST